MQSTINEGNQPIESNMDGRPSRQTEEVAPLTISVPDLNLQNHNRERAYIHQAQISIMVTGIDDWFWTGYCFVDTYFKPPDQSDSVEKYHGQTQQMDPFSCGKYDANFPLWLPRHYFLCTLAARMEQVQQEWSNSASVLFRQIDPWV